MSYSNPEEKREYQRLWMARRRDEFFRNKTCVHCGSTDQLELDHIDPRTKINNTIWSWSRIRRDAEIAKCQVLCHDCHIIKTKINRETGNFTQGENHGSLLTNAQVLEARKVYAQGGITQVELARQYGVARSTIGHMLRGTHHWKNI